MPFGSHTAKALKRYTYSNLDFSNPYRSQCCQTILRRANLLNLACATIQIQPIRAIVGNKRSLWYISAFEVSKHVSLDRLENSTASSLGVTYTGMVILSGGPVIAFKAHRITTLYPSPAVFRTSIWY